MNITDLYFFIHNINGELSNNLKNLRYGCFLSNLTGLAQHPPVTNPPIREYINFNSNRPQRFMIIFDICMRMRDKLLKYLTFRFAFLNH